ncbi:glycosyltransferase family 4 protein [Exiguobacterium sp. s160]|uniref:glycosyltransferase family 4 protein n=1 Tax=Exiguobacterium sp. s160 TaxID=2751265 RepID=UPI001BE9358C|nr:glycosyltransferase family 4 protein [Exiguobacterium sp. s160]
MQNKCNLKVLYIGDFLKKNGPSWVDISLTNELEKINGLILSKVQINFKFDDYLNNISSNDIVHISGISFKGLCYMIVAKILKKKTSMTSHGSLKVTKKIVKVKKYREIMESSIFLFSDLIVGVSEKYAALLKSSYPKRQHKIKAINNGIEIQNNIQVMEAEISNNEKFIITFGGGRSDKGVLGVCEAIEELNKKREQRNKEYKLIVIGEDGPFTDKIKEYPFVQYKGFVNKKTVQDYILVSGLYIQNSWLETFCMSALEALHLEKSVILSKNVFLPIHLNSERYFDYNNKTMIRNKIEKFYEVKDENVDLTKLNWKISANKYLSEWSKLKNSDRNEK